MKEKTAKLISIQNAVSIDKNSYSEFLFEFQKNILLTLSEQGVINAIQCQQCVEKLSRQFNN